MNDCIPQAIRTRAEEERLCLLVREEAHACLEVAVCGREERIHGVRDKDTTRWHARNWNVAPSQVERCFALLRPWILRRTVGARRIEFHVKDGARRARRDINQRNELYTTKRACIL
jgi:hypothetical protein